MPVRSKLAHTISYALVKRYSPFFIPETLHSDHGAEFENTQVKELQVVFDFKKTRTSVYRLQVDAILERTHSTTKYVHYVSDI